jgi:hypothetical protein
MGLKAVQFLAVVLTALALIPAGAHLFELPNKIGLAQDQYFTVQAVYRGWALFGVVLLGALAANLALAIMLRRQRAAFWLALAALILMASTLAIFFAWTFPANQATNNWTAVPPNWEQLRWQWEYAHATNAVLTFLALCSLTLSLLTARD